jgi:hypothetical protein
VRLRRHLQVRVVVADGQDEGALVGVARHDGGAGVAPLPQTGAAVDHEAAFDFVGRVTVALVAVLAQHGTHPRFKKLQIGGRDRGFRGAYEGERREE